jgi:hypothetical protein
MTMTNEQLAADIKRVDAMTGYIDREWRGETRNGKKIIYWRVWINCEWYKLFTTKREADAFKKNQTQSKG